jgi:hypothetical protein
MKHIMRYNEYQSDKLSHGHPVAAVCARGDLAKEGPEPKGCFDTKVCACCVWCGVWGLCLCHRGRGGGGCLSRRA